MNILDTKTGFAVGLGLSVILAIYLFKDSIANGAAAAGQSINPVNPNNVFADGVDAVGEVLTGNEHFKLGGWIYDKVN